MSTVRWKQHSFSTHERMVLSKCRKFWDRKYLDPTSTFGFLPSAPTIWALGTRQFLSHILEYWFLAIWKKKNNQIICIVFVAQIVIVCIDLSLRYAWWSHGHYGVSHHPQLNCLFSNLIMRKRQKSAPRSLLFVWGSHRCQMVSPHTGYSNAGNHYNDVIMTTMASQITSLTIVYSIVYSGADQRKHQSSASLAFFAGNSPGPVNSPHKGPVTRKIFPFDDVIMCFLVMTWSVPKEGAISQYWFSWWVDTTR